MVENNNQNNKINHIFEENKTKQQNKTKQKHNKNKQQQKQNPLTIFLVKWVPRNCQRRYISICYYTSWGLEDPKPIEGILAVMIPTCYFPKTWIVKRDDTHITYYRDWSLCHLCQNSTVKWNMSLHLWFKGTKWAIFEGKRIHSTLYWTGSIVSAGIRTPGPWVTKRILYHWAIWLADEWA